MTKLETREQRDRTAGWAVNFRNAAKEARNDTGIDPRIFQAHIAGMIATAEELEAQVGDFDGRALIKTAMKIGLAVIFAVFLLAVALAVARHDPFASIEQRYDRAGEIGDVEGQCALAREAKGIAERRGDMDASRRWLLRVWRRCP